MSKTTGKKKSSPKSKPNTRGAQSAGKKTNGSAGREVITVILAGICVFMYVSIAGSGGVVGEAFSDLLFGLFGWACILLPIAIIAGRIYDAYISKKDTVDAAFVAKLVALCLFICCFMQLIHGGSDIKNPAEVYLECAREHVGGGFFGGCLAFGFVSGFGLVGAYIFTFLAFIVIILLFLGSRVVEAFKQYLIRRRERPKKEPRQVPVKRERVSKSGQREPKVPDSEIRRRREQAERERVVAESQAVAPENVNTDDAVKEPVIQRRRSDNVVRGIIFENLAESSPEATERPTGLFEQDADPEFDHVALSPTETEDEPETTGTVPVKIESLPEPEPIKLEPIRVTVEPEPLPEPIPEPVPEPEPLPEPIPEPVPEPEPLPEPEPEPFVPVSEPESEEAEYEAPVHAEPVYEEPVYEEPVRKVPVYEGSEHEAQKDYSEPEPVYASEGDTEPVPEPEPEGEPVYEPEDESLPEPVFEEESEEEPQQGYIFPHISLLNPVKTGGGEDDASISEVADKLVTTLKNFGVEVTLNDVSVGPTVTRFEIIPSAGTKVSKIQNLQDDIKLNLATPHLRIEAPIPGKSAVGIEVPNKKVTMVGLRELIESDNFRSVNSGIAFGAGKDIGGNIIISDIAKMPHVLIAGATGSGKSVCINTIIMSILYKADPDDVKFIMIDPKVVELSVYNGIPHLLIPVVTDAKKAAAALNWAVHEMNERYQKFAELGVRDMSGYNKRVTADDFEDEGDRHKRLPQIVVIVDELADLMMVSSSEVEEAICRLAQLARAAGIHLVIATQRPSVNVITGLIKANMPSRIAFAVTSGVDSRTILDMNGAEKLLGKGDMLYFPQGMPKPVRVQGAFVSDDEVYNVVSFIKENNKARPDEKISQRIEEQSSASGGTQISEPAGDDLRDAYFEAAGRFIIEKEKASIGLLQRNFKIGFNRAARIMDQLGEAGVVGPEEGTKPRKILVGLDEFEDILKKGI